MLGKALELDSRKTIVPNDGISICVARSTPFGRLTAPLKASGCLERSPERLNPGLLLLCE